MPPASEHFWQGVDRSGGPAACWPWRRAVGTGGYGCAWLEGKGDRAHRIALRLTRPRQEGEGPFVLHSCDNRLCCNPAHLRWGTHTENAHDREERHRSGKVKRRGLANPHAVDLVGRRFGRLLVLEAAPVDPNAVRGRGCWWVCACDCGARCTKRGSYLLAGDTLSCGCLVRELARERMRSGANPGRPEHRARRARGVTP